MILLKKTFKRAGENSDIILTDKECQFVLSTSFEKSLVQIILSSLFIFWNQELAHTQ